VYLSTKTCYNEEIMCGRFGISLDRELIEQHFGAKFEADFRPRYNAAPSQSLPVILNEDPKTIRFISWGLRPAWLKKAAGRKELINVKAETLRDRPTFKGDLTRRRCLVPADGFYEWQKTGKPKIPYRISLKSGELFAFAGIWQDNTGEDGNPLRTFAIITTAANSLVGQIHDRMPVILKKDDEKRWIDTDITTEKLLSFLRPYPANFLQMYEISSRVNRTTEDLPELIKPVQ
jgi:putative SOS response-associated peptidase YedK